MKPWNKYILPVCILLLGAVLRLYALERIPPGLWYDEAIHGLDTLQITELHQLPIFFNTENHPQEPMFSYVIALNYLLFGVSPLTLRLTSALLGILTLILFYLAAEKWFGPRIAQYGLFFLAISKWHLMFSRLCFRTILTPIFTILVLYFLYRGLKKFRWSDYVISGLFLGLGMYTYISFRVMPLLVILIVLHEFTHFKKENRWNWDLLKGLAMVFFIAFLVFVPLLIDFIHNPFHYSGRTAEISIFNDGLLGALQFIGSNTIKTLGMFSVLGDPEPKHNYPGEPMLPLVLSIIWVLGIWSCIKNIKDTKYAMVLAWFLVYLVPGIFSQGAPNSLRTLGGVPALCLMIAIGFTAGYEKLADFLKPERRWIITALAAAILIYSTGLVGYQYFYRWGTNRQIANHFNINEYQLGEKIRAQGEKFEYYLPDVLANQMVIRFVAHPVTYHSYTKLADLPVPGQKSKDWVLVSLNPKRFSNIDSQALEHVLQSYPGANLYQTPSEENAPPWIVFVYVPGTNE